MIENNLIEEDESSPRSLVSIQRIIDLEDIPCRERIVLACVLGYKCIVKKGEFKVGDLCVLHEVDSVVPTVNPAYAFLGSKEFERIKTMILTTTPGAYVYSQGLALPLSILPEIDIPLEEGRDVTEEMGVKRYSAYQLSTATSAQSRFEWPALAPPKTDELRLQRHTYLLEQLRGMDCYVTMKLDGCSFTAVRTSDSLIVCSRNHCVEHSEDKMDVYNLITRIYNLAERLPVGAAIQGEICGPGVQKNKLGLDRLQLFVFNVFVDGAELGYPANTTFCHTHELKFVPVLQGGLRIQAQDVAYFVALATPLRYSDSGRPAEGLVVRPTRPTITQQGARLSFKVINPEFELAEK